MTAKQMTESQIVRFTRSMEEQGVGVTRTKKGLFLRLPNGESTTLHFTNSDVRAPDNLMSRLRRAGVRHPDDSRAIDVLPKQITESGQPATRTRQRILNAIAELDYPTTVKVPEVVALTNMEHVTISRALFHMDFKPIAGKRNSRDWLTPAEILELKPKEVEVMPVYEEDTETVEETPADDTVKVELSGDREFIDTYDSWIVDLSRLPREMKIGDYIDSMLASGLEFEVRMWRK